MRIIALAGGVGGAKLADGLAQILSPEELTIIVNTGDDFEHLGLYISPDVDTVCYTLAGIANPATGWGRADDTFEVLEGIRSLAGMDWFRLGDKDIATHIERTRRLKKGQTLSEITRDFCKSWGVLHTVLPMSDDPVRTMVDTVEFGELPFQEYFVHHQCEPRVKGFRFAGIETAQTTVQVQKAIKEAEAIVVCPSNPWVSIDPILALSDSFLSNKVEEGCGVSVVAVSPIIGGQAVKGPAAKMYLEMGIVPSALAVAEHYRGLLSGFVLDTIDAAYAPDIQRVKVQRANVEHANVQTYVTDTVMKTKNDRRRFAQDVLNFIQTL